jgi:hypothetical protein
MHAVQQPLAASALQGVMGVPAWKSLPSWYLVAAHAPAWGYVPPSGYERRADHPRKIVRATVFS